MPTARTAEPTGNRLLDALPVEERERWFGALAPRFVDITTVLFEPGQAIESVYFPLTAVIALVAPFDSGAILEVATVGNEGIVGVPMVLGGSLAVRTISQVAGWVLPMAATAFVEAVGDSAPVRSIVDRYVQVLFGQISRAAGCNRLHSNEQRLSRWLLMSRDRAGVDTFTITPEFLGQLLGGSRATVTVSAGILQAAGLITYRSGNLTVVDHAGLEAASCECYAATKAVLDALFNDVDLRGRGVSRDAVCAPAQDPTPQRRVQRGGPQG